MDNIVIKEYVLSGARKNVSKFVAAMPAKPFGIAAKLRVNKTKYRVVLEQLYRYDSWTLDSNLSKCVRMMYPGVKTIVRVYIAYTDNFNIRSFLDNHIQDTYSIIDDSMWAYKYADCFSSLYCRTILLS
jgi:hypothetical protein